MFNPNQPGTHPVDSCVNNFGGSMAIIYIYIYIYIPQIYTVGGASLTLDPSMEAVNYKVKHENKKVILVAVRHSYLQQFHMN